MVERRTLPTKETLKHTKAQSARRRRRTLAIVAMTSLLVSSRQRITARLRRASFLGWTQMIRFADNSCLLHSTTSGAPRRASGITDLLLARSHSTSTSTGSRGFGRIFFLTELARTATSSPRLLQPLRVLRSHMEAEVEAQPIQPNFD